MGVRGWGGQCWRRLNREKTDVYDRTDVVLRLPGVHKYAICLRSLTNEEKDVVVQTVKAFKKNK